MPNGTQQDVQPFVVLDQRKIDVTGGGRPDLVRLVGHRMRPDSVYFEHVYVQVFPNQTTPERTPLALRFPGGYDPKMQFCDFTGERIADVFISEATGGSGGIGNYYLATFAREVPRQLPVPQPLQISGRFLDNYKVVIEIAETGQKTVISVADKKAQYEREGLYRNGKLVQPTSILPNDFSTLQPIDRNRNGICELRGIQRIAGAYNADTIAYVYSIWGYNRIRQTWVLLQSVIRGA